MIVNRYAKQGQDSTLNESDIKCEIQEISNNIIKLPHKETEIDSFEIPRHYIKMVTHEISNSLFLIGDCGLGKSYLTINTVKKEVGSEFVYFNGVVTPLSLFKLLYLNREKMIILDDVYGLFESERAVSLLKSVLWSATNRRIVHYESTSKYLKGLPDRFEFRGRLIILANKLNSKDPNIMALMSRGLSYEVKLTYYEKIQIMKQIVDVPYKNTTIKERREILEYLTSKTGPTTKNFNFRTLVKSYDFFIYDKQEWRKLIDSILVSDEAVAFVYKLMNTATTIPKWKIFNFYGYGSRRTYFRILKALKQCQGALEKPYGIQNEIQSNAEKLLKGGNEENA